MMSFIVLHLTRVIEQLETTAAFFFTKSDVHVCSFCSEIRVNQIAAWMEKQEEVYRT